LAKRFADDQTIFMQAQFSPVRRESLDRHSSSRTALVRILQNAFSGELAAAYAYRGHWKSLKNTDEIRGIQKIENEEWLHRDKVGEMLATLGAQPKKGKEIKMRLIGRTIGVLCHLIGWFLPMYFAGRLESQNIKEYADAAVHASVLGLTEYESELRVMSAVEKEHEVFFFNMVASHRLLPIIRLFFHWGWAEKVQAKTVEIEEPPNVI
jgi:demethoxyubiquinone hydroxylase (CLK1/Coq7/Cat5 family)